MTDGQFKAFVINLLRRGTFLWKPRGEAKKRAKVPNGKFKNGKTKYGYQCNICKNVFKSSEVQIDHIEPVVGPEGFVSWDLYISRMFCDVDNLQTICSNCHDEKSRSEKEIRKNYKKSVDKSSK